METPLEFALFIAVFKQNTVHKGVPSFKRN